MGYSRCHAAARGRVAWNVGEDGRDQAPTDAQADLGNPLWIRKGEGFDVKVIKEIIKLRKQDQNERDEHETLLDLYMRAMDGAQTSDEAKAA